MEILHAWGKSSGWKRKTGTLRLSSSKTMASACSSSSLVMISTVEAIAQPSELLQRAEAGTGSSCFRLDAPDQLETEVLKDVIDLDKPIVHTFRAGVVVATATPHFGWSHLSLVVVLGTTSVET